MKLVSVILMILIGLLLEWQYFNHSYSESFNTLIIAIVLLTLLGYYKLDTPIDRLHKKIDGLSNSANWMIFVCIFIFSCFFFPMMNLYVGRSMHPVMHDDQMHAIQVQMLAKGRLWMPAHPMADFFETFHVYVKPLYAPFHFPGTAILNVLGVWLHLPTWFIPNLLISASCALAYHVTRKVTSNSIAILIPPILWCNTIFHVLAPLIISHNAMIFLGLLWITIFLEWQKKCHLGWALILGIIGGFAAVTRPIDAISFGVSIFTGIIAVLMYRKDFSLTIKTCTIGVVGVLPFIGFQTIINHSITGSWSNTPYKHYSDLNYPNTIYAGKFDNSQAVPRISVLQQKQDYYEDFMLKYAKEVQSAAYWSKFSNDRLPDHLKYSLSPSIFYFFVPIGLLGIKTINRWVVCTPAIFFFLAYFPFAFYGPQYVVIIAGSVAIIMLLGVIELSDFLQTISPGNWKSALWLTVVVGCFAHQYSTMASRLNITQNFKSVNYVQEYLPNHIELPALIFCKYDPQSHYFHDEPVYNFESAWPDDAKMVLAQWLGDRNNELMEYYRKIGQNRTVYELDQGSLQLTRLGKVNELIRP